MGCIKETDSSDCRATERSDPPPAQTNQDATGDPVNVVTGAFMLSERDAAFPVGRMWLELTRHYNNQLHDPDPEKPAGPFGRGWSHTLHLRLEPTPDGGVAYIDDRHTRIEFQLDSGPVGYIPPPGSLGLELIRIAGGGFHLRQIDGLVAEFDAGGRIVAMIRPGPEADSHLDFRYDDQGRLLEVAGAGGRAIHFGYDSDSLLIRSVTDHTGRRWRYRYNDHQELVEVRDPAGRVWQYAYTQWDGLLATDKGETEPRTIRAMSTVFAYTRDGEHDEAPAELKNQYTSDRRVYRQVDAFGNVAHFDYNRFTRTTSVTDPAGWTTVYCYDAAGNTTKVRRPGGGTTEYVFDDRRNLLAEIDPFGHRTEYVEFRDPCRLEREQEFGRRAIANRADYLNVTADEILIGYDRHGNRPLVHDALGNTTRFDDHTRFGRPRRVELPDGSEIRLDYDDRSGLPVRQEQGLHPGSSEALRWIQEWQYDVWGNLTRHVESAEGASGPIGTRRVLVLEYDAKGQNLMSRRAWIERDGQGEAFASEERYEWDALGRLVMLTDLRRDAPGAVPQVLITRFGYDSLGRQIWQIHAEGTATCYEYDPSGRVVETFRVADATPESVVSVPEGSRLDRRRRQYDRLGREVRFIDPVGVVTSREWDQRGLCIAVIDPLGHATRFEYDRDGNQTRQGMMTGYEIRTAYDKGGRPVCRSDSSGRQVTYRYDPLGRVQEVIEGSGETAATTCFTYDVLGRLAAVCFPDGAGERRNYDARGNLIRRERGSPSQPPLAVEVFAYDALGRLAEILTGASEAPPQQFTLSYDDPARLVSIRDALGNVTHHGYDSDGNLIRKSDAAGRALRLEYDSRQRLSRRWSDDRSVESDYEYDGLGQLTSAREGPVRYRWQHDAAGRMTRHDQMIGGRTISVFYEYDPVGRLIEKRIGEAWWMRYNYVPDSPFVARVEIPGASISVVTDPAGRMIEEHWSDGGLTRYEYWPQGELAALENYDASHQLVFGQRLTRDGRGRPSHEVRCFGDHETHYWYHYDNLDRLAQVDRQNGAPRAEFRRYVYDERGNRLEEHRDGSLYASYRYNAANRLIEMCRLDGVKTYQYDKCGNLLGDGASTFTYDAAQRLRRASAPGQPAPAAEYQYAATGERVVVTGPSGSEYIVYDGAQEVLSESPGGRRVAFWGFQLDTLLAASAGGQPPQRAYTTSLGSVVAVGRNGDLRDYDPFGNVVAGMNPPVPFGFCGKRFDPETGLYYNRARFYDPISGRFAQPDAKGIVDGANVYLYACDNPVHYLDPLGFKSAKESQGRITSPREALFSPYPDLSVLRGYKIERYDASGRRIETTFVKGPGLLEGLFGGGPHLEHYDVSGNPVGRSYPGSHGLFGPGPQLVRYDTSGQFESATYVAGPGLFESRTHLEHYDPGGQFAGSTYRGGPGLFGPGPDLVHYDPIGHFAGTSYLKRI